MFISLLVDGEAEVGELISLVLEASEVAHHRHVTRVLNFARKK
jgi:hypothetical protein